MPKTLTQKARRPDLSLFKLMVESVQDYAIFLLDADGHVTSWNRGAALIKQYSADEIIGEHFSIFYTPADIERKWPEHELQRALHEGRFEDNGWRIRKDGNRFWANVIITALRDEYGNLQGFSKITRDLTDRKIQEETLRQSEERFRLLVDGVQDYAIYMLDPDGIVTSWNVGAHRIKGYESTEIIGKHFSLFYSREDRLRGKPGDQLALAREYGRSEDEGWRLRKDGSRFCARVVITTLFGTNGDVRGYAKITQDLTQRRHSETLEDTAKYIHEFIAVLAHELRNPLAPIRNAVHVLKVAGNDDSLRNNTLQIIDRQSGQLMRIVDDILDVSRVTRGTLSITKRRIAVSDVVIRAVETARPAMEAAKHILEIDLSETPLFIEGDEVRIAQALTNLLNNAARYTNPNGNIWLKVFSTNRNGNVEAAISVRDTGRGIQPDLLGAIFGMFVQGHDQHHKAGTGLGVGLALARSIAELHHGTLEAFSEGLGRGSEFVMRFPLSHAPVKTNQAAAAAPTYSSRRILVVDDNVDAATVLASFLKHLGQDVYTVHDGIGAIQAYENLRPEIILLDVGMPGMDGLEVARTIREHKLGPQPLIVAVTGWGKPEDELRSKEAGFDMHLVKPVEVPLLLRLLELKPDSLKNS